MIYLIDTNVLLRVLHSTNPSSPLAETAVRKLLSNGHQLHATMQNFVEFWNVSTRPIHQNGMGLSPSDAVGPFRRAEQLFPLLSDLPTVYAEWRNLVVNYGVSGVQVHDARLVATMLVHGVTHILTFNTSDFARYNSKGIVAVDPATV